MFTFRHKTISSVIWKKYITNIKVLFEIPHLKVGSSSRKNRNLLFLITSLSVGPYKLPDNICWNTRARFYFLRILICCLEKTYKLDLKFLYQAQTRQQIGLLIRFRRKISYISRVMLLLGDILLFMV